MEVSSARGWSPLGVPAIPHRVRPRSWSPPGPVGSLLPPFPQRSRIPTWKLILLVGAVAGTLTAVYAVYNATTGLIHTSPGCNTMVVGLTAPEAVPNGFRFGVTLVSR